MTPDEKLKAFAKRVKKNRTLRHRVRWYKLGQRRCHCCGVQLNWATGHKNSASVEHMIPGSYGGTFHQENIIITCSSCNGVRGNRDFIEWVYANKFPKTEWLISKYLAAYHFYKQENIRVKISKNIGKGIEKYKNGYYETDIEVRKV